MSSLRPIAHHGTSTMHLSKDKVVARLTRDDWVDEAMGG